MKWKMRTAVVLAAVGSAGMASATVIDGPIVNPANGHSYYLLSQNVWTASEAEAQTLGGHLVTINNAAENAFVYSTFSHFNGFNNNLWIGLYDLNQSINSANRATRRTEFRWIDGEPVTYSNWSPVEPNNPDSNDLANPEFYVHIWNPSDPSASTWNNYYDNKTEFGLGNFGVVEAVPEPTAFSVVGLAAFALSRGKKR